MRTAVIRSLSKLPGRDLEKALWPGGDFGLLHTLPYGSEFLSHCNELNTFDLINKNNHLPC